MVRLAVDANSFRGSNAGIARYLRDILVQVVWRYPDIRLILYSASDVEPRLPLGNWRLRSQPRPGPCPASHWLQNTVPRWLASDEADVFWGQNLLPLRLRRHCRRVLTVHDLTSVVLPGTMSIGSRFAARSYLGKSMKAADHVLADSRSTAAQIRRHFGTSDSRLSIVYPGFGEALSDSGSKGTAYGKTDLGVDRGYLLAVGTIEPRKGYDCLLDALGLLPAAPKLMIAGAPGWQCRHTLQRIRRMEQDGRVRYLGRVSDFDLAALYKGARLLVFASPYEGFGLPVLEAMAHGCPVLCSWSSSLPEVGGSAVRYFLPGEPADLADRLRTLLSDETELARMAHLGIKMAAKFDPQASAEQFVGVVRRVVCSPFDRRS